MPTMPTMPSLPKLPSVDLSALPKFPKVQLPKVQLPKVQLPALTGLPLAQIEHDVVAVARDAAYASIGLGVLAVQQAQRGVAAVSGQLRRYAK
jgi:hypothetical protein